MREVVERAPSLPAACWELVEIANGRGGDDNITVILAEVTGEAIMMADEQASLTRTFQVLAEYKAQAADLGLPPEEESYDDDEPLAVKPLVSTAPGSTEPAASVPAPSASVSRAPAEGGTSWLWPLVAVVTLACVATLVLAMR